MIPKIYQLVATLGMKANSRSSILLLLLSLLPVIRVESVACNGNISMHVHSGGTSTRVMTVCSLTPIWMLKACKDLKLQESYASSLSSMTGKGIRVLSSNGLTRLVTANKDTGIWMVSPSFHEDGSWNLAVIHIDTIFRAAHLIPIYSSEYISHSLKFYHSIDSFHSFYVNKFADHHAFEIAS
jgi:hypothetical protein